MSSAAAAVPASERISTHAFYGEYHGHTAAHLAAVERAMRAAGLNIIWLAGDSSLDNKYWLPSASAAAPGIYSRLLEPAKSVRDVAYWVTLLAHEAGLPYACLNAAVEESTVGERASGRSLLPQDEFLRDHLQPNDIVCVSVGGNDVALRPTVCTIASMGALVTWGVRSLARQPALGHFTRMYTHEGAGYLAALADTCVRTHGRPHAATLLCSIYFPDMNAAAPSWASGTLAALGYASQPAILQAVIRDIHEHGVKRVRTCKCAEAHTAASTACPTGQVVLPVPLFSVLDGTRTSDYVARVEPSVSGGRKMAELFMRTLREHGILPAVAPLSAETFIMHSRETASAVAGSAAHSADE